MKTPEDEAFDDLAKRQGAWGGGFEAKRKAAMDKINADFDEDYIKYRTAFPKREAALDKILQEQLRLGVYGSVPQPAQEPPSEWAGIKAILDEYGLQAIDFVADFKAALAQPAQEPSYWLGYGLQAHTEKPFDDATPLYTTPPQREWVGLTAEETSGFTSHEMTVVKYVSKVLQEKNNGT